MNTGTGFQRIFLIFVNEDGGYEAGQKPSGHVRIETRDGKGKLHASIQNLRPGNGRFKYFLYLIGSNSVMTKAASAGELAPNPGKAELEWSFDPRNVGGTGAAIGEFDVAAVLAEHAGHPGDAVICPLAAYKGKKTEWRNGVRAVLMQRSRQNAAVLPEQKQAQSLYDVPGKEPVHEEPIREEPVREETVREVAREVYGFPRGQYQEETFREREPEDRHEPGLIPPMQGYGEMPIQGYRDPYQAQLRQQYQVPPIQGYQVQQMEQYQRSQPVEQYQRSQPVEQYQRSQPVEQYQGSQPVEQYQGSQPVEQYQGSQPVEQYQGSQPMEQYQGLQPAEQYLESPPMQQHWEPQQDPHFLETETPRYDMNQLPEQQELAPESSLNTLMGVKPEMNQGIREEASMGFPEEAPQDTQYIPQEQENQPNAFQDTQQNNQQQTIPCQAAAGQIDTGCVYLNGNMCNAFVDTNTGVVNPCASCHMHSGRPAYFEPPVGDISQLREELGRYFEECDPFHSHRSDYTWWRVGNPVNLNNLLYQCNIRSPLLFNPAVMMAHYKYRHLIVGIYRHKTKEKEYVVCGVPGMSLVDKKPFGDMSRWVQAEGNRPRYGAFGYWLVYIDPDGGKILNWNQE